MPGAGEIEYPKPETALQQHLHDTHHNLAAGGLTDEEADQQHVYEHLGPGGLRNHSEPAALHQFDSSYARQLTNLIEDTANVMREADEALSKYPLGWVERERLRATGGQLRAAFNVWRQTLSEADRWGHCGDVTPHDEHRHTVTMNEGSSPGTCVGTPDLAGRPRAKMALPTLDTQPDDGVERSRALRAGSQPLPVPQAGVAGAHDMVLADLRGIMTRRQVALRNAGFTKEAEAVRKLIKEIEADLMQRRALGLKRYGSLLQPGNGRDPLRDAYEEVVDLVAYFKQLMMARDEAVTLLTELLGDHAVGDDPVVRENVGRVMYLLAGAIEKGSKDGSVEP